MTPKALFISDLDGTLLYDDSSLSPYSRQGLENLLEAGVAFSVATARSIPSTRLALGELGLSLPIVCSNGAYISDLKSGEHRHINSHPKPTDTDLLDYVLGKSFHPFLGTFDGVQDHLYLGEIPNEGMAWYKRDREKARDKRLKAGVDVRMGLKDHVISLNVIDRKGPILELAVGIEEEFPGDFCIYTYEDWYDQSWLWLSVYHKKATKGEAIKTLLSELNLSLQDLTVFGDNLNDLSMFKLSPKAIAVGNARAEVKQLAHEIIETNKTDAVVKYIAKVTGHAGLIQT
jgi:5-amino-6-(5-phospho-D-ribitylamino)uracil phosphatase